MGLPLPNSQHPRGLRTLDRQTSTSYVLGQVFTDSTPESSGRLMAPWIVPKTHTQSPLTLVLAFTLPRTFGWWSPTWVPRTLDGSVWLQAKLAHMCAARGADCDTPIRGPVGCKAHLGPCCCGAIPTVLTSHWVGSTRASSLLLRALTCS